MKKTAFSHIENGKVVRYCGCGKKITRGKYCGSCRMEAKKASSRSYYARRGRWLRMKKRREKIG